MVAKAVPTGGLADTLPLHLPLTVLALLATAAADSYRDPFHVPHFPGSGSLLVGEDEHPRLEKQG